MVRGLSATQTSRVTSAARDVLVPTPANYEKADQKKLCT